MTTLAQLFQLRADLRERLAPCPNPWFEPPGDDAEDIAALIDGGAWWLLPIFGQRNGIYCLSLGPDAVEAGSRVVLRAGGASTSWCSSLECCADRTAVERLDQRRSMWAAARADWATWSAPVRAMQSVLNPRSPGCTEAMVADDSLFPQEGRGEVERGLARVAMFARSDPAVETQAYAEQVRRCVRGEPPDFDPPVGFWRTAFLSRRYGSVEGATYPHDVALALLRSPIGEDMEESSRDMPFMIGSALGTRSVLRAIQCTLMVLGTGEVPLPPELDDPLGRSFHAWMVAREARQSFDGSAFFVAAAGLSLEGRVAEAWTALQSASWFMTQHAGTMPIAVFKAAIRLSEEHRLPVAPLLRELWAIYLSARPDTDRSGV